MDSKVQETPKSNQQSQSAPPVQADKKAADSSSKESGAQPIPNSSMPHESQSSHSDSKKMTEPKEYQHEEKDEAAEFAINKNI